MARAGVAGPGAEDRAGDGVPGADRAGGGWIGEQGHLRRSGRGCQHGRQVASTLRPIPPGPTSRRTAARHAAHDRRRRDRRHHPPDPGSQATRRDALVALLNGPGRRLRSIHDPPHLARRQPHRTETFKLSNDPGFVEKVRRVKPRGRRPRPWNRSQPLLPMRPGQVERRTHDDTRHGTPSLFAARDVARASSGSASSRSKPMSRETSTCIW